MEFLWDNRTWTSSGQPPAPKVTNRPLFFPSFPILQIPHSKSTFFKKPLINLTSICNRFLVRASFYPN
jgi:hypothetical protein